jgi:hypothetical protein
VCRWPGGSKSVAEDSERHALAQKLLCSLHRLYRLENAIAGKQGEVLLKTLKTECEIRTGQQGW